MQAQIGGDHRQPLPLDSVPPTADAADFLDLAIREIDDRLGQGYAANHHELLAALIIAKSNHALIKSHEALARSQGVIAMAKKPAKKPERKTTPTPTEVGMATQNQKKCIRKQFWAMKKQHPMPEWLDSLTAQEADGIIKDCLKQLPRKEV
jgi:hypothetical protein